MYCEHDVKKTLQDHRYILLKLFVSNSSKVYFIAVTTSQSTSATNTHLNNVTPSRSVITTDQTNDGLKTNTPSENDHTIDDPSTADHTTDSPETNTPSNIAVTIKNSTTTVAPVTITGKDVTLHSITHINIAV